MIGSASQKEDPEARTFLLLQGLLSQFEVKKEGGLQKVS